MKILFTGASSFTGLWFIRALVHAGHEITAVTRSPQQSYQGIRKHRIDQVLQIATCHFECAFGSPAFLKLLEQPWDMLCHHAAEVRDYQSEQFDLWTALQNNTNALDNVLSVLQKNHCRKIILSGSFFEQNEGTGPEPRYAFSPYGLSKTLTWEVFRYVCYRHEMALGKFVLPNPFGPWEEFRFTTYMAKEWLNGRVPEIKTPHYVRDNIHVDLLAACYRWFVEMLPRTPGIWRHAPSGYTGSMEDFAKQFAEAMQPRLDVECPLRVTEHPMYTQPMSRINTDKIPDGILWNEQAAWDALAKFYQANLNILGT